MGGSSPRRTSLRRTTVKGVARQAALPLVVAALAIYVVAAVSTHAGWSSRDFREAALCAVAFSGLYGFVVRGLSEDQHAFMLGRKVGATESTTSRQQSRWTGSRIAGHSVVVLTGLAVTLFGSTAFLVMGKRFYDARPPTITRPPAATSEAATSPTHQQTATEAPTEAPTVPPSTTTRTARPPTSPAASSLPQQPRPEQPTPSRTPPPTRPPPPASESSRPAPSTESSASSSPRTPLRSLLDRLLGGGVSGSSTGSPPGPSRSPAVPASPGG